jgi:hypothetical protein
MTIPRSTVQEGPIPSIIEAFLPQFDRMIQSFVLFNTFFLAIGAFEFLLLIFFFTFLVKSAVLAFSLAILFLTFFSYFIFRLYAQVKKPQQFQELQQRYIQACKNVLRYREGTPADYVNLANSCMALSYRLKGKAVGLYRPPTWLNGLIPYCESFGQWCHSGDILRMRELLLLSAIQETIARVKCIPTDVEVHISLGNGYLLLSQLYAEPMKAQQLEESDLLQFESKFRQAVKNAIEEFKIVAELSPEDPVGHAQLAATYHALEMPLEEIREYEILMRLNPTDVETLCTLGKRYFEQGFNAQGLRLYAALRSTAPHKAEELIKNYGNFL